MEEGKVGEQESRIVLRKNVLRDISYLQSKNWLSEEEVYDVVKNFLKDFLNLKYEFTKDELFSELKNIYLPYTIRSDFFKFVDKVFMFEYAQVKYSDSELRKLLTEFRSYLDYLLVPGFVEKSVKAAFLNRVRTAISTQINKILRKKKVAEIPTTKEKLKKVDSDVLVQDSIMESHADINGLIERIYLSIDHKDLASARLLYKKVMAKYQFLSADDKSYYYEKILSIYNLISSKP